MTEYVTVWENHQPTTLRWAVPVVRCRDCRRLLRFEQPPRLCCGLREPHLYATDPDGFCAWGVRRGDAE